MSKLTLFVILSFFTIPSFAVDDPAIQDDTEQYDAKMCVNDFMNDCVNTNCLTSEDRDCTDKCRQGAEDKCSAELVGDE